MVGSIIFIAPLTATLAAPFIGYSIDRFSRVSAVAITVGIASIPYLGMGFISDPTGGAMIALMCVLGVGEIGAFISSQALITSHAPKAIRGSVTGCFGFAGALGILFGTAFRGWLFDKVHESGPFVMFGIVNVSLCIWALKQRLQSQSTLKTAATTNA